MENEKNKASKNRLKNDVFSALLAINSVEVPKSLVNEEIDALRNQALQQYGQIDISKLDVRALMPDELSVDIRNYREKQPKTGWRSRAQSD